MSALANILDDVGIKDIYNDINESNVTADIGVKRLS